MRYQSLLLAATLSACAVFAGEKADSKSSGTLSADAIPAKIAETDINGANPEFLSKYFILTVFPQKMQLADGKMTEKDGKVLIMQKDSSMIVAFYRPENGQFVLTGKPTVLSAVVPPRADVHPQSGLPCIVVRRQGTADAWRLFLKKGHMTSEPFVDEAVAKTLPAKNAAKTGK